jgi:cephalosporin hydroxylase
MISSGRHRFLSHDPIVDMTEVNEHAVKELLNRGSGLSPREFVHLIERHHPTEEHGVSRETLAAYADAVAGYLCRSPDPLS